MADVEDTEQVDALILQCARVIEEYGPFEEDANLTLSTKLVITAGNLLVKWRRESVEISEGGDNTEKSVGTEVAYNLHAELSRLARECDEYAEFRKRALARTPDVFKPSVGPHLLDWYVEFKYSTPSEKEKRRKQLLNL